MHSQRKDRHAETGLPIWGAQNCQRTQGKRCDEGMGVKFRPKNGQERRRVRAGRGGRVCWRGETSVERGDTKESACIAVYQAEAQQGKLARYRLGRAVACVCRGTEAGIKKGSVPITC